MMASVLQNLFTVPNLLFMNLGLAVGVLIGALPGLTTVMGIALILPLTFGLPSVTGMILLIGVYCGGIYGGSITAILIKTPGTPSAAITVLDGYTMAQKGKAGLALDMALSASVFGGIFSGILLLFFAPQLARFALRFGPPEYFALGLFGISVICFAVSKSFVKGFAMAALGLFVCTIGTDPIGGLERFAFGNVYVSTGIQTVPMLVGVYALPEIFEKVRLLNRPKGEVIKYEKERLSFRVFISHWKLLIKSAFIGSVIGAIPGTGSATAAFMSYNEARRSSKTPDLFGTGIIEGVGAPEAANNAVTGSAMIPMLTLGIPGDSNTALMLGALMMQGITPGPRLFVNQANWVYTIMVAFIVTNILLYFHGRFFINMFSNVMKIPERLLLPIILVLCSLGAFAINNMYYDMMVMFVFGLIGWAARPLGFPVIPMVIAKILGPLVELNLRRTLAIGGGSIGIIFTRPIAGIFTCISITLILLPAVRTLRNFIINARKGK